CLLPNDYGALAPQFLRDAFHPGSCRGRIFPWDHPLLEELVSSDRPRTSCGPIYDCQSSRVSSVDRFPGHCSICIISASPVGNGCSSWRDFPPCCWPQLCSSL